MAVGAENKIPQVGQTNTKLLKSKSLGKDMHGNANGLRLKVINVI